MDVSGGQPDLLSQLVWRSFGSAKVCCHRVTEYALEGCKSGGQLAKGVLRVLSPTQVLVPRVLVAMTEGTEEATNLLDLPFRLPVRLWMVSRREADGHT